MNTDENVVIQNIQRTSMDVVNALGKFAAATIADCQNKRGIMACYMRPVFNAHIAGNAVTVSIPPGDNWMLPVAIEQCKPGDILVVAPTSPSNTACFGGLMATSAKARGARGLIMEGGVRDTKEFAEMNFPAWSKYVNVKAPVKENLGSVNIPISIAGVTVNPGDVIVADEDGVVVVKREEAAEVAAMATKKEEKEVVIHKKLVAGELVLDLSNMREKLKAKGLIYK